jgi:hypothetical protein
LLALPHIDEVLLVRKLRLFEHDVDFLHVRAGQRIKINHVGFPWRDPWTFFKCEAGKLSAAAASGKALTIAAYARQIAGYGARGVPLCRNVLAA